MNPGLELKGISKKYGDTAVLKNISLSVEAGELLVLLGPSGSGKTTLLRVIAGLVDADEGSVYINGSDVTDVAPAERGVAMVFQSYALFPHLTIFDNLAFGLQSRRVAGQEIATKVAKVAKGLRLTELLQRYPREISGGERQRVALGRALLREPAMFLMDEPLSNLDTQLRSKMRVQILKLHEQIESTMVYVTHDQLEALSMGDKIGVLRKGRLEQLGTADEIYNSPRNLFVARFIGNPMMNTIAIDEIKGCSLIWKGNSTPIAGRYLDSVKDRMDAKVLLGVRAEHICLEGSRWASVAAPTELVGATVQRVELAGDQKFITLDADGIKLTTRCEPDLTIRNGDEVRFWFDAEQLHIFDAENGRSLLTEENV